MTNILWGFLLSKLRKNSEIAVPNKGKILPIFLHLELICHNFVTWIVFPSEFHPEMMCYTVIFNALVFGVSAKVSHDTSDYTSIQSTFFCCRGSIAPFSHTTIESASELVENNPLRDEWTQHATVVYLLLLHLVGRAYLKVTFRGYVLDQI